MIVISGRRDNLYQGEGTMIVISGRRDNDSYIRAKGQL